MTRLALTLLLSLLGLAPGFAQDSPGAQAARASFQLREATQSLEAALNKDDQVTALTEMIGAYESGLAALRAGLRQAGMREQTIRAQWLAQREQLSALIGAMMTMEDSPEALMLLHPAGPLANAQAGMILSDVVPALREEADALKAGLDEIAELRDLQEDAAATLAEGLGQVQTARRLLVGAASDRSTMPKRFGEDPAELKALEKSASSLDAFAEGIADLESDVGPPMADFEAAQGALSLPVMGQVLRAYQEPDAAGIARPGLVLQTAPASLVTTPWPATIRYRGPLLDYGNVMILEPAKDYLLILAGMAQVFGEVGDVLSSGEPVGLMGGTELSAEEFGIDFVVNAATGRGADRTETLYLELRHQKQTLDPSEWFVLNPIVAEAQDMAEDTAETQADTE